MWGLEIYGIVLKCEELQLFKWKNQNNEYKINKLIIKYN